MINLITEVDFKYPYNVIVGTEDAEENLNLIIELNQPAYLKKILGEIEYAKFEENIDEAWWQLFINGDTYSEDTGTSIIEIIYPGIKPVLAHLIYYDYQKAIQDARAKDGVLSLQVESAIQASPKYLIVGSYNKGINEIRTASNYDGSVYNYLTEKEDDFPEWNYTQMEKINTIGI